MEYARLGEVVFKVPSYRQHKEEEEYSWAKQMTVFAPSTLSYHGAELRKLQLQILLHREFTNPLEEKEKLRELARTGTPARLLIGNLRVGTFVIEKAITLYEQIDMWGVPVRIVMDLSLIEYVPKEIKTRKIQTKGPAVVSKKKNTPNAQQVCYKSVKKKNADGVEFSYIVPCDTQ